MPGADGGAGDRHAERLIEFAFAHAPGGFDGAQGLLQGLGAEIGGGQRGALFRQHGTGVVLLEVLVDGFRIVIRQFDKKYFHASDAE